MKNIIYDLKNRLNLSIWLDYLDREVLELLPNLVKEEKIYGITTNPTIFNNAINKYSSAYLKHYDFGANIFDIIESIMIEDVKKACEILLPLYEKTNHQDGLVSIELPPYIAYDEHQTIHKAKQIWEKIQMPNVMIKVPATNEGINAIKKLFEENINVNITLLFSVSKYIQVVESYKQSKTQYSSKSITVASFFVSRVDTAIDNILHKMLHSKIISQSDFELLIGNVAVANCMLAYKHYLKSFNESDIAKGEYQRILWASTSTKNPSYHQLKYVIELLTPNSINTIPYNTYQLLMQSDIDIDQIKSNYTQKMETSEKLVELLNKYINLEYILEDLLYRGVTLFSDSYNSILYTVIEKVVDNRFPEAEYKNQGFSERNEV
ncbi:MAG: transaldolase [bacterium]